MESLDCCQTNNGNLAASSGAPHASRSRSDCEVRQRVSREAAVMIITLSLALHCLCHTAAFLHYDQERYQYEDSLIRADRGQEVRALPLNYRLPQLPTTPPAFQSPEESNVMAMVGSTVVLACRVTSLGSFSVSWLRLPQLTVLSSGSLVFSSSPRVSVVHGEGSPDYNLQISRVVPSDAGHYHCQLNTRPARSVLVRLAVRQQAGREDVVVPALALTSHNSLTRTEILAPDLVTDTEGGTVTLECVVTEHDDPPTRFTW